MQRAVDASAAHHVNNTSEIAATFAPYPAMRMHAPQHHSPWLTQHSHRKQYSKHTMPASCHTSEHGLVIQAGSPAFAKARKTPCRAGL